MQGESSATFAGRLPAGLLRSAHAPAVHIRGRRSAAGLLFTVRIHRESLSARLADAGRRAVFAAAWDLVMGEDGAEFRAYKGLAALNPAVRLLLEQGAR